jgi:hypothetical protein
MYDQVDERNVPKSAGIPRVIYISAIVGIIAIFMMLTLVFSIAEPTTAGPAVRP